MTSCKGMVTRNISLHKTIDTKLFGVTLCTRTADYIESDPSFLLYPRTPNSVMINVTRNAPRINVIFKDLKHPLF